MAGKLQDLFCVTGRRHPADLSESDLTFWVTGGGRRISNNYVRQRLSTARTFLAWCERNRYCEENRALELDFLKKQYPKVYGKRQGRYPARFLTADEAAQLVKVCQDGTWIGSRDQLAIRLGLLGCRAEEAVSMTWGNLDPDGRLRWIGKGRRMRTVSPGAVLLDQLARWRRHYESGLGRSVLASDPIICRQVFGAARQGGPSRLDYGTPIGARGYFMIVNRRGHLAGLGHVAAHDLRRTAASILHNAKTPDGGHLYDLLDIQQVLDHADPATTQRSYIDQVDTGTKDRAGATLDLV